MEVLEQLLGIVERRQRSQVLKRVDTGFGRDANINWLLHRVYHILSKG